MKIGLTLEQALELFDSGYPIKITLHYDDDHAFSAIYDRHDFEEQEILIFQKIVRQILKNTDKKISDLIFEVA